MALVSMFALQLACAATITWEPARAIAGASDVSTEGTYVGSWAPYHAAASSYPVNGVRFQGYSDIALTTTGFWGGGPYFGSHRTPDGNYNQLLQYAAFGGQNASIKLDGLVPGQRYLVQFWASDARALTWWRGVSLDNWASYLSYPANGSGMGQHVVGRFTADASQQVITLRAWDNPNGANASAQVNLLQVRRVTQAGPQPGDQVLRGGDINVLMYDRTHQRSADLVDHVVGSPAARWWVRNWQNRNQQLTWKVYAPAAGAYRVEALMSARPGTRVRVSSAANSVTLTTSRNDDINHDGSPGSYWDRIPTSGYLSLPAGTSFITIVLDSAPADFSGILFKSLELVHADDVAPMASRAAAMRSSTQWLRDAKYGLMFQWGGWGFPASGPALPWPGPVNAFNVRNFVDMVESTGARYVIWSVTWTQVLWPGPNDTIDRVLPGRTAQRDLLGEMATALNDRHIKLMLYYNEGINDPAWWARAYDPNDPDAKQQFFDVIRGIVSETGRRYGTRIAGWFFDDGAVFYPAPFESLTRAAKEGHPDRLVSYNSWILPRFTDFQDVFFGEGFRGSVTLPQRGSGIFSSGPWKGLYAHGMNIFDGPDWGIYQPNTVISHPQFVNPNALILTDGAQQRGVTLTWDLNMYENGSVSPRSLDQLRQFRTRSWTP